MVMFTVGTGIGGGLVMNSRLLRGTNGIAGELGHVLVVPNGHPCGCGRLGCIEQYASGKALVRFAQALPAAPPAQAAHLLKLAGGAPEDITGQMVTAAAKSGDPAACEAFSQIGYWLGQALAD